MKGAGCCAARDSAYPATTTTPTASSNRELGRRAVADRALAADCVAHARMFFNSPDLGLDLAGPGTFALAPSTAMIDGLRRDYARMAGMIIGTPPEFDDVIASIADLENEVNR